MHAQVISELLIEETYLVPAEQTARHLFGRLPHGRAYADRLIEAMATAYLVAVAESVCARALQPHLDPSHQTVVGTRVQLHHAAPATPGTLLRLSGWVERLCVREVGFALQAHDHDTLVCEAEVVLRVVERHRIDAKVARQATRRPRAVQHERVPA